MKRLNYLLTLFMCIVVKCDSETCSSDKETCGNDAESNRYTKRTNERYEKYYKFIEDAKNNYVSCNMTNLQCYTNVITKDLRPFKSTGITKKLIDDTKSKGTHYQIIDHKLYREKNCMFPSRCAGIEHFILNIIDTISDMDLIINTRDYPQSSSYFGEAYPVFSFSKTDQYFDITYPAWSFWEGGPAISLYPRGLGRWDKHRISLNKAREQTPWDKKYTKAFFRGSRTSSERDNLIHLSRENLKLVDAQYTKNQAWRSDADTLNMPPAPEVSLEEHCKYKYLFNYRGVAASFRHKHLFLCESLVFHVGKEWVEFYYNAMKPWIHYIPVPKNANQNKLKEMIEFVIENEELAKEIARQGRDFIWKNLDMKHVEQYWKKLLKKYAKLIKYKPILDKQFMRIVEK